MEARIRKVAQAQAEKKRVEGLAAKERLIRQNAAAADNNGLITARSDSTPLTRAKIAEATEIAEKRFHGCRMRVGRVVEVTPNIFIHVHR